jgi:hypothetical protein
VSQNEAIAQNHFVRVTSMRFVRLKTQKNLLVEVSIAAGQVSNKNSDKMTYENNDSVTDGRADGVGN